MMEEENTDGGIPLVKIVQYLHSFCNNLLILSLNMFRKLAIKLASSPFRRRHLSSELCAYTKIESSPFNTADFSMLRSL